MGSCRALNALLGMSLSPSLFEPHLLLIAGGLGVYVAGITWFARCEAKQSNPRLLVFGFSVMATGIAMMAVFPYVAKPDSFWLRDLILWPTLLVLLMTSVVRACVRAISNPEPSNVQAAVKHSLFTLILLDAAVVLAIAQRGPQMAIVVVALLLPSTFLGKWVYST